MRKPGPSRPGLRMSFRLGGVSATELNVTRDGGATFRRLAP